jgi:hypothetical protein
MIRLAIKPGTLAPILMALSTAPSPALAAGGGGGWRGASGQADIDQSNCHPVTSWRVKTLGSPTRTVTQAQALIEKPPQRLRRC